MVARQETVYEMEAEDGSMVRVPESKVEDWSKAQARGRRQLTNSEKRLRDKIVSELLGRR